MHKERQLVLQKVSIGLLKTSIFIAKMRKPILADHILLKKSKKLKRFKHYNYKFLEEYQFSASSIPLIIHYHRRNLIKNRRFQNISSMLFFCRCFGGFKAEAAADIHHSSLALETVPAAITGEVVGEPLDLVEDEEYSVHQRAEKFIEWFYQEMRLQWQESV